MHTEENSALQPIKESILNIKKRDTHAYKMLEFISLINNKDIPLELLETWGKQQNLSNQQILKAISSLVAKGFLFDSNKTENNQNGLYETNDIIQDIIIQTYKPNEISMLLKNAIKCLNQIFSGLDKKFLYPRFHVVMPHLQRLSEIVIERKLNTIKEYFRLQCLILEYILIVRRDYAAGKEYFNKIEPLINVANNTEKVILAKLLSMHASILNWGGDPRKSIETQKKVLNILDGAKTEKGYLDELSRSLYYLSNFYSAVGQT